MWHRVHCTSETQEVCLILKNYCIIVPFALHRDPGVDFEDWVIAQLESFIEKAQKVLSNYL